MPFLNTGAKVQKTGNGGRETGDGKRETVIGLPRRGRGGRGTGSGNRGLPCPAAGVEDEKREMGNGEIGLLRKPELKGLIAHLRRLKKGDGTVFIALQAMLLIFAPLASAKGAKSSGQDGCI